MEHLLRTSDINAPDYEADPLAAPQEDLTRRLEHCLNHLNMVDILGGGCVCLRTGYKHPKVDIIQSYCALTQHLGYGHGSAVPVAQILKEHLKDYNGGTGTTECVAIESEGYIVTDSGHAFLIEAPGEVYFEPGTFTHYIYNDPDYYAPTSRPLLEEPGEAKNFGTEGAPPMSPIFRRVADTGAAHFYLARSAIEDYALLDYILLLKSEKPVIKLGGRTVVAPRHQFAVGDKDLAYRFSGSSVPARPWTIPFNRVRRQVEKLTGHRFNYILVNIYKNGGEYIGPHSDDLRDQSPNVPIVSLSLGATRAFRLAPRIGGLDIKVIELSHGDLLIMGAQSQELYKHSVPKRTRVARERVSLTFRSITHRQGKK